MELEKERADDCPYKWGVASPLACTKNGCNLGMLIEIVGYTKGSFYIVFCVPENDSVNAGNPGIQASMLQNQIGKGGDNLIVAGFCIVIEFHCILPGKGQMIVEECSVECGVSSGMTFLATILVPGEPITPIKVNHKLVPDGLFEEQVVICLN